MSDTKLRLKVLKDKYGVCRLAPVESIPEWAKGHEFCSITKTSEELSIVCPIEVIPSDIQCESDWNILKILGPLDFSMIGILSAISSALAERHISIFAVSTYDTDYILVKDKDLENAIETLRNENIDIITL